MFLTLLHASASPAGLIKTKISRPHPHVQLSPSVGLAWSVRIYIPNKIHVMLMLSVWNPHFEKHWHRSFIIWPLPTPFPSSLTPTLQFPSRSNLLTFVMLSQTAPTHPHLSISCSLPGILSRLLFPMSLTTPSG